jgi:hypothetical protein
MSGLIFSAPAHADNLYATEQRRNAAIGHYARARAMLVEALAEFEQGRKFARPDLLVDPEEWRLNVISRTEELNRIIDPKPKVTIDGVVFKANPLLIRRERDRTPPVADGAKESNVEGEIRHRQDMRQARARMEIPVPAAHDEVKVIPREQAAAVQAPVHEETAKKAEKSLSFDTTAPVPEGDDNTAPDTAARENSPAPADQSPAEPEAPTAAQTAQPAEPKAMKLIPDEEEVVTTKKVEVPKSEPQAAEAQPDTAGQPQTIEAKEDEVTKEIERAIQERIQKEQRANADRQTDEDEDQ